MKRFQRSRVISALLALTLIGSMGTVTAVVTGGAAASAATVKFGSLASPCGPGKATGATEQGVSRSPTATTAATPVTMVLTRRWGMPSRASSPGATSKGASTAARSSATTTTPQC